MNPAAYIQLMYVYSKYLYMFWFVITMIWKRGRPISSHLACVHLCVVVSVLLYSII